MGIHTLHPESPSPRPEKGLTLRVLVYGFRYYDPETGRWPSRDPLEEHAFVLHGDTEIIHTAISVMGNRINLAYGFISNDPIGWFDVLGLTQNCQTSNITTSVSKSFNLAVTSIGIGWSRSESRTICDECCADGSMGQSGMALA
jgi:RHS repeat-associated protein